MKFEIGDIIDYRIFNSVSNGTGVVAEVVSLSGEGYYKVLVGNKIAYLFSSEMLLNKSYKRKKIIEDL